MMIPFFKRLEPPSVQVQIKVQVQVHVHTHTPNPRSNQPSDQPTQTSFNQVVDDYMTTMTMNESPLPNLSFLVGRMSQGVRVPNLNRWVLIDHLFLDYAPY